MSKSRRFHQTPRSNENFTEDGLTSLTGQSKNDWGRYTVKELVDNALEESDNPHITVRVTVGLQQEVNRVEVEDDGPGIPEEGLRRVLCDIDRFGGTKRHYKLPTRGNQGNALMTILGIQSLSDQPLEVYNRGERYEFGIEDDHLSGSRTVDVTEVGSTGVDGFGVSVNIPSSDTWHNVKGTLAGLIALNPQAGFSVIRNGEAVGKFPARTDSTVKSMYLPKNTTTGKATWFTEDDFRGRLKADIRANKSLTVSEFVSEFKGLSSVSDRIVSAGLGLSGKTIQDLASVPSRETRPLNCVSGLYWKMKAETSRFNEDNLGNTLGSVGKDLQQGLLQKLKFEESYEYVASLADQLGETPESMMQYYAGGAIVEDGGRDVPFYFELAVVPKRVSGKDQYKSCNVVFGVNQSVTYSNPKPNLEIKHKSRSKQHTSISDAFREIGHDFEVVTNLTCPNIQFQDKGKQKFDTSLFEDVIEDVVGKAVRKVERDYRPRLNDLREGPEEEASLNKAPNGYIKNFIFDNFEDAYAEGTQDGKYEITMRQLYYVMRPMFQEQKRQDGYEYSPSASRPSPKKLKLRYGTFTDNIEKYEEQVREERVVLRDSRGYFVEPHSEKRVDLGTVPVREYTPDLNQYGNLLFVEKTGFFNLLHEDFELSKRYDIGIINAKGWSPNATRNLVQKIQDKNPDVTLYTLTDLDINGFGIAQNIKEADNLSPVDVFETERIGLTPEDVEEWNLPAEEGQYNGSDITALDNRYRDGDIPEGVYKFLKEDNRVEINALSPVELKEYLETKFDRLGIEKVRPESPEDVTLPEVDSVEVVRKKTKQQTVGDFVLRQAQAQLVDAVMDESLEPDGDYTPELDGQEAVFESILDNLEDNPPKNWKAINEAIKNEQEAEAESRLDTYREEVSDGVQEFLEQNVEIDVRLQKT